MKISFTLIALLLSANVFAANIVATAEEEKAIVAGMMGMMARLEDPAWIKLAQENSDGCWLDKNTLVNEGSTAQFEGVSSTCVAWGSGLEGKKIHMFFPSRLAEECRQSNLAYNICVQ